MGYILLVICFPLVNQVVEHLQEDVHPPVVEHSQAAQTEQEDWNCDVLHLESTYLVDVIDYDWEHDISAPSP